MAAKGDERNDFYAVLGLKKECSVAELKNAYKKLALLYYDMLWIREEKIIGTVKTVNFLPLLVVMKWHPDRYSASGNPKHVDEAKKKFQAIQEAYSVLSDANNRFLYDVGVYDCDGDDDENGMGDFLNEMATMMTQNKSNENGEGSFEELQELFEELFQSDVDAFTSSSSSSRSATPSTTCWTSSHASCSDSHNANNKRHSSGMSTSSSFEPVDAQFEGFCMGTENQNGHERGRGTGTRTQPSVESSRRNGRKQKVSFDHDVSWNVYYSQFS